MDYELRIKIGDTEVFESDDINAKTPFISNVRVKNSTSLKAMEIGATASDCLYFTLYNPYKVSFDGERVELWISANGNTSALDLTEIEDVVGLEAVTEVIDENEVDGIEIDEEEGTDLSPEDEADVDETEAVNTDATYEFFNGEDIPITEETTGEEAEPDWVRVGVFYVFNQNNSTKDNAIRFECLDGFSKLNGTFKPAVEKTNIQRLYDDFRQQVLTNFDVVVDEFEFDTIYDVDVNWNLDCSYRQAIGYFAGLVGGFATFGDDDTLGISFYGFNDRIVIDDALIKYNETSAGEAFIESGMCDRSVSPYKEDIIESGIGQGFNFFNPFVNQDMLDEITDYYHGIRYVGAELTIKWHEGIQAGEFVRIMSPEEYANYVGLNNALDEATTDADILDLKEKLNSLGRVILVSNQTIDFTGEATSDITSICNTEYNKENKVTSPSDMVLRNLYAEMVQADYIDAKRVVTEALEAGTAEIKHGIVENLDVNSINGNVIKNSAVLAKALSNEMVETVLGVKVFYSGDAPTAEKPGDIWYKTIADKDFDPLTDVIAVWDGEKWVDTDFSTPDSIFMANSIIAQDINANQVTSNSAFMNLLETRLARIGDVNGNHMQLTETALELKNGNTVLGKFASLRGQNMDFIFSRDFATIENPYPLLDEDHERVVYPLPIDFDDSLVTYAYYETQGTDWHELKPASAFSMSDDVNQLYYEISNRELSVFPIPHSEVWAPGYYGPRVTDLGVVCNVPEGYSALELGGYTSDKRKLLKIGNGLDAEHGSDALALDWQGNLEVKGDIYSKGHNSPIGTYLVDTLANIKVSAGVDLAGNNGASLLLGPGSWIISGYWAFNTRASGTTNINKQLLIIDVTAGTIIGAQRIMVPAPNYSTMTVTTLTQISSEHTIALRGTCSSATTTNAPDNCVIRAMRIA